MPYFRLSFSLQLPNHRLYNSFPIAQTNLTLPPSNSDIIPALTCRALDSFPSSAEISASMLLRVSTFHFLLSTLHQPHPPRQQHGHHALLDLSRLGQFLFERGDFSVHVAQDFGNSDLFDSNYGDVTIKLSKYNVFS